MKKFKKVFSTFVMVLALCLVLPLTMLFSGCGATPTNDVNAVNFVSNNYDNQGRAIFEVDLNVPKTLTYKVNPSTWSGYSVTYGNDATAENRRYFELKDGVVTVGDSRFVPIIVEININDHKDSCVVKLKEYPIKVYTDQTNIELPAQGMYAIDVLGEFAGETAPRHLTESEFNFKVVSNDETKVQVPNSDRLMIYAVCSNAATTKITVSLLDESGKTKFSFDINVKVVQSASKVALKVDGVDKFIKEGDTLNFSAASMQKENGSLVLGYSVNFFSSTNLLLDGYSHVTFSFSDASSVSADLERGKIIIKTNVDLSIVENYTFTVSMIADVTDLEGKPLKLTFKIVISK